jgi:hypothetical protein
MDIAKARIDDAPGFHADHFPDMANQAWAGALHTYYGTRPN